jgi:hypothetical protein
MCDRKYEEREMEFTVMRLRFPRAPAGATDAWGTPEFAPLARFTTHGAVMNVFLLDPAARVLAAYIWLAGSKTIGLYVLPDWDVPAYALVDTTLPCVRVVPRVPLPDIDGRNYRRRRGTGRASSTATRSSFMPRTRTTRASTSTRSHCSPSTSDRSRNPSQRRRLSGRY